jgi:hypothetical protein
MNEARFDANDLIDALAPLLGITITPESRDQVIAHLDIAARHAAKLLAVPPDDHQEPAPVFTP